MEGRPVSSSVWMEADTSCPSHPPVPKCQIFQRVSGTAMDQPPQEAGRPNPASQGGRQHQPLFSPDPASSLIHPPRVKH